MVDDQSWQQKYQAIEEEEKEYEQELARVRKAYIIETDVRVRFKLEQAKEEIERALQSIEQKKRNLQAERLFNCMIHLDYSYHSYCFNKFYRNHPIGAFVIHGSPEVKEDEIEDDEYGLSLRSILKRFLIGIPYRKRTSPIEIQLYTRGARKTDLNALWRRLCDEFGLETPSHPVRIAQRLSERLKNQSVILIVHDIDCVAPDYLEKIIKEFWVFLALEVQKYSKIINTAFLMFLVDYSGCVKDWNIEFAQGIDEIKNHQYPYSFPIVRRFTSEEVSSWVKQHITFLGDLAITDDLTISLEEDV
jgi:hypothetical protein